MRLIRTTFTFLALSIATSEAFRVGRSVILDTSQRSMLACPNRHQHRLPSATKTATTTSLCSAGNPFQEPFSKTKWKKKRFLMIKDVQRSIHRKDPNAVKNAEAMVHRMQALYEESGHDFDFKPTVVAYNTWIHALAKSKWSNAGVLAEEVVVKEMEALGISPNVVTYSTILDAYSNSDESAANKAESLMTKLLNLAASENNVHVSSITCDTILNVYAKEATQDAAERAQEMLFRLERLQRDEIKPTKFSYATVMNAWAGVGTREAAERAEYLLNSMLRTGTNNSIQPDTTTFNACIKAWALSSDAQAGSKAINILNQMKRLSEDDPDMKPDTITYNTILSCWSHSGHMNAAPRTEKLIFEMQQESKAGDGSVSPNTISMNTALHAWSVSPLPNAAPRAQKVLDYMIASKRKEIAPDIISFTSVINAWAKSKAPFKARKAKTELVRLENMYEDTRRPNLRPTIYAYNAVLNACAFSALGTTVEEQRDALKIAVSTFSGMRRNKQDSILPDTVTYGNLIKCLANLMPAGKSRSDMGLQIFEHCCNDGLVGALVWNEVRRVASAKVLSNKLNLKGPPGTIQLHQLPQKWRKNNLTDKNAPVARTRKTNRKKKALRPKPRQYITEQSYQSGKDI